MEVEEVLKSAPLFSQLQKKDIKRLAAALTERSYPAGAVVIEQGMPGVGLFVMGAGRATASVNGKAIRTFEAGDHFGEVALIDRGARMATITAVTDLVCYGLTYWDFRPFVEQNGAIGWKLLERMAMMLRDARKG